MSAKSSTSSTSERDTVILTAIITSIFFSILTTFLVSYIPLPRPNFTALKTVFGNLFKSINEKRSKDDDNQCFICLADCDENERDDENEQQQLVFFAPCFHKVCQSCCISLYKFNQPIRGRGDNDNDFDEINLRVRNENNENNKKQSTKFSCPLCRQAIVAVLPMKIFSLSDNSAKLLKSMEEEFPHELRAMNHTLFYQTLDTSDDKKIKDEKPFETFQEFLKGEHLGFGRNNNDHDSNSIFTKYDWRRWAEVISRSVVVWSVAVIVLYSLFEALVMGGSGGNDDQNDGMLNWNEWIHDF